MGVDPMRKLFLQINMTVDGFIEDSNREIDWHFSDDEFEQFIVDTLQSIDGMVFGRVAFELLAQYWPTAAANPQVTAKHVEMARLMNELPKYVISTRLRRVEWRNSHIIGGDAADAIRTLKEQPGKDIALFAGAGVVSTFMQLGLLDEYRLILNPIFLGSGTPLFKGGYEKHNLSCCGRGASRRAQLCSTTDRAKGRCSASEPGRASP
jgi:dihydrofolate reductase